MPEKPWEQMTVDEKLEQLRRQHGQEIADLHHQIGALKARVDRLEQSQRRAKP
jgi:hypothetical protein